MPLSLLAVCTSLLLPHAPLRAAVSARVGPLAPRMQFGFGYGEDVRRCRACDLARASPALHIGARTRARAL